MQLLRSLYDRPVFRRESPAANKLNVIRWWESRRIFFNLVVGCAGVVTCVSMIICAFVSEPIVGEAIGLPDGPLLGVFGIIVYAILANICYSFGAVSELLLRTNMPIDASAAFAVRAFRAGITFSTVLTLTPAIFCWFAFAWAFAHGQTHAPAPE
jgi:hypothetical protein